MLNERRHSRCSGLDNSLNISLSLASVHSVIHKCRLNNCSRERSTVSFVCYFSPVSFLTDDYVTAWTGQGKGRPHSGVPMFPQGQQNTLHGLSVNSNKKLSTTNAITHSIIHSASNYGSQSPPPPSHLNYIHSQSYCTSTPYKYQATCKTGSAS